MHCDSFTTLSAMLSHTPPQRREAEEGKEMGKGGEYDREGESALPLPGRKRDAAEGEYDCRDGAMDERSGWRCSAVIFPARWRRRPAAVVGVASPPEQPFVRYSCGCCISRSRAATAVLTADSSSDGAGARSDDGEADSSDTGEESTGDARGVIAPCGSRTGAVDGDAPAE